MKGHLLTIVEFPSFANHYSKVMTEEDRDTLFFYLSRYPEAGAVIPGTGGIRKLRWEAKGSGKRGGARVIYFFYNKDNPVFLLTVYKKGAKEDLSSDEKKELSEISKILKEKFKK